MKKIKEALTVLLGISQISSFYTNKQCAKAAEAAFDELESLEQQRENDYKAGWDDRHNLKVKSTTVIRNMECKHYLLSTETPAVQKELYQMMQYMQETINKFVNEIKDILPKL